MDTILIYMINMVICGVINIIRERPFPKTLGLFLLLTFLPYVIYEISNEGDDCDNKQ